MQILLDEEIIAKIAEGIQASAKKEEINRYINETCAKCNELCKKGESVRVLNAVYFMFFNLKKEFNF